MRTAADRSPKVKKELPEDPKKLKIFYLLSRSKESTESWFPNGLALALSVLMPCN
jgi:hypothetical protein